MYHVQVLSFEYYRPETLHDKAMWSKEGEKEKRWQYDIHYRQAQYTKKARSLEEKYPSRSCS